MNAQSQMRARIILHLHKRLSICTNGGSLYFGKLTECDGYVVTIVDGELNERSYFRRTHYILLDQIAGFSIEETTHKDAGRANVVEETK